MNQSEHEKVSKAREALAPCAFCGAPGYAMLAGYGFKIKCTNTECTVETPIRTHRHQVDAIWNRRAALDELLAQPVEPQTVVRDDFAPADMRILKKALLHYSRSPSTDVAEGRRAYAMWQVLRSEAQPPKQGDAA